MAPIDGPLDYHRYPPRDRRKSRTAPPHTALPHTAPSAGAPSHMADEAQAAQATPPRARQDKARAPRRTSRRSTRHRTAGPQTDAQQLHMQFDPADDPERHTPPQQRRGSKARRKRHRSTPAGPPWWKRARRCAGVLLLIGIAEITAAALTARDFRVQAVEVAGLDVTSPAKVRPLADELVGQNWIRANTQAAIEAARALPTVRAARVERTLQWPPQLILRLEERRPFARVGAGDDWWVVDESGVPFRRARKDDHRLYAVTSKAFEPLPGRALPAASWQPVVTFARALSQDGSTPDGNTPDESTLDGSSVSEDSRSEGTGGERTRRWALRRIYFDKDGFASLRLEGGAHDELLVRLGAGRWPEKLQRAHQALAWFERTGGRASELNLVSYNMPVWTPRTASDDDEPGTAQAATDQPATDQPDSNESDSIEPDGSHLGSQPSSRQG